MDILPFLKNNLDSIAAVITSTTIIGLAAVWIRKRGCMLVKFVLNRIRFQGDIRNYMEAASKERVILFERSNSAATKAAKASARIEEISVLLKNGISHKLALQAAQIQLHMESEMRPLFMCDEGGRNIMVSFGYLKLLGIHNRADLADVQWHQIICGDLKDTYFSDFITSKKSKGTFMSSADLQNPYTGEHRGRWRVIAPCAQVNEALIFTGRLIPIDKIAQGIAQENEWVIE